MKPWYRSLLFWIGAFFAVAILWLWWDSHRRVTGPGWSRPGHYVYLVSENGEISLEHYLSSSFERDFEFTYGASDGGSFDKIFDAALGDAFDRWSFGPLRGAEWERGKNQRMLPIAGYKGWFVSWWFVFCGYLVTWVGLMAWWRRRVRRRAAALMKGGEA